MDNTLFERRKAGSECPMCPDTHGDDVVAELPSGYVHLKQDADYRGYCILICRRHVVELFELTETERQQWIEDIARIGKAIEDTCHPAKLNVSMLGNMVPHLHCHVMPRYPDDPEWGGPPAFRSPEQVRLLTSEEFTILKNSLRTLLAIGA